MQPLSHDMITAALQARGFAHIVDADGDVAGNFDGNLVYFFRVGEKEEILQVRTMVQHPFGVDAVPVLQDFCNDWNANQLWPKAYVHVTDDDTAIVIGEVISDCEHGVTAEQLDQALICGIATGCRLSESVGALKAGA